MCSPRIARWLVSRAVTSDARHDILQFLDEEFERRAVDAPGRARRWYWRQALSFSSRFMLERLRGMPRAVSATDLKLALRMLVRYPGLTIVATAGMAVGIAIGAGTLSMLAAFA